MSSRSNPLKKIRKSIIRPIARKVVKPAYRKVIKPVFKTVKPVLKYAVPLAAGYAGYKYGAPYVSSVVSDMYSDLIGSDRPPFSSRPRPRIIRVADMRPPSLPMVPMMPQAPIIQQEVTRSIPIPLTPDGQSSRFYESEMPVFSDVTSEYSTPFNPYSPYSPVYDTEEQDRRTRHLLKRNAQNQLLVERMEKKYGKKRK